MGSSAEALAAVPLLKLGSGLGAQGQGLRVLGIFGFRLRGADGLGSLLRVL